MHFSQIVMGAAGQSSGGLDVDAAAWAAAVVVNGGSVSGDQAALTAAMIGSWKAAGAWDKLDDAWVLVAESSVQALTSIKQRRLGAVTAAPTFTVDRGYAFNGSTQFIDTGFICSTMAVALTLGNLEQGVYERTNNNNNTTAMGGGGGAGVLNFNLRPRGSTSFAVSATQIGAATSTDSVTDSRGLTSGSRSGNSTTTQISKNGVDFAPITVATPATSLLQVSIYLGANNNIGTANGFRASTLGFAYVGAPMTAPQRLAFYNGLQTYMTAKGAQV